jgi:hypothetical protein
MSCRRGLVVQAELWEVVVAVASKSAVTLAARTVVVGEAVVLGMEVDVEVVAGRLFVGLEVAVAMV